MELGTWNLELETWNLELSTTRDNRHWSPGDPVNSRYMQTWILCKHAIPCILCKHAILCEHTMDTWILCKHAIPLVISKHLFRLHLARGAQKERLIRALCAAAIRRVYNGRCVSDASRSRMCTCARTSTHAPSSMQGLYMHASHVCDTRGQAEQPGSQPGDQAEQP